jgi:hypothetical protein
MIASFALGGGWQQHLLSLDSVEWWMSRHKPSKTDIDTMVIFTSGQFGGSGTAGYSRVKNTTCRQSSTASSGLV